MGFKLVLQMFAEGGDGGSAPAADGATASNAENPLADVVYGKQAVVEQQPQQMPETKEQPAKVEDRKATFEELIKGEYKPEFDERVQQVINRRFKEHKANEERLASLQPVLDALGSKYGVETTDLGKLMSAIEEDDSFYQDEADRKGVTVQQLKQMRKLERDNAELKAAMEQRQRQEQAANVYAQWEQDGQAVKQLYGNFDLRAECQHPETGQSFVRLLQNGIDVRTAYEVVHKDELLSGAIGYAVQTAQKRTMDNIRAKGMRPQENGAGGSIGTQVVKSDPSKWSDNDLEEVLRRVKEGKKINL